MTARRVAKVTLDGEKVEIAKNEGASSYLFCVERSSATVYGEAVVDAKDPLEWIMRAEYHKHERAQALVDLIGKLLDREPVEEAPTRRRKDTR